VNTTSASCKRRYALIEAHHQSILERLESGEMFRSSGQHQEINLARPGDTRWGSHHQTLIHLDQMWNSVIEVLGMVDTDGRAPSSAGGLIEKMESFKFAFILKLMLRLLGITNELSHVLQRKDINILHAMDLISVVNVQLVAMRESG
jgi:hypothetical protein